MKWVWYVYTEQIVAPEVCHCEDKFKHGGYAYPGPPFDGLHGHIPRKINRYTVRGLKVVDVYGGG